MLVTGTGEWERCEVDGLGPAHGGWLADTAMREDRMGAMPNVEPFFPCVVVLVLALGVSGWVLEASQWVCLGGASAELKRCSRWSPEGVSGCRLAQKLNGKKK